MKTWDIWGIYSIAKYLGTVEADTEVEALRKANDTIVRPTGKGPGCPRFYYLRSDGDRVTFDKITAEEDTS